MNGVGPHVLELVALVLGERVEPQAGLQGEDGDVEPVALERAQPRFRIVVREVDRKRAFGRQELVPGQPRRVPSLAKRRDERRRPEVLVDVERGHHEGT